MDMTIFFNTVLLPMCNIFCHMMILSAAILSTFNAINDIFANKGKSPNHPTFFKATLFIAIYVTIYHYHFITVQ